MGYDYTKDEVMRLTALDRALASGVGNEIDKDTAFSSVNADKILEAAKKFEAYLTGGNNGN